MDLGIKGKKAIVCAASKGLGRACAMSLAREGVEVVITARTAADLERTADEIRKETGVKVTAVARRHHHRAGRAAALAACPRARHPGEQRRRPAARRFPRMGPRRLDQGGRRQHADADLADQGGGRRHDRAQIRPHRQHHLGLGEVADPRARHEQRRARRADRLRRRPRAPGGAAQRHHQQHPARPVPHRPAAQRLPGGGAQQQPAGG